MALRKLGATVKQQQEQWLCQEAASGRKMKKVIVHSASQVVPELCLKFGAQLTVRASPSMALLVPSPSILRLGGSGPPTALPLCVSVPCRPRMQAGRKRLSLISKDIAKLQTDLDKHREVALDCARLAHVPFSSPCAFLHPRYGV